MGVTSSKKAAEKAFDGSGKWQDGLIFVSGGKPDTTGYYCLLY